MLHLVNKMRESGDGRAGMGRACGCAGGREGGRAGWSAAARTKARVEGRTKRVSERVFEDDARFNELVGGGGASCGEGGEL